MKRYISKSNIAINVVLSNGASKHIVFSPITATRSSVFYTDNAEIIKALERHYRFGKLFKEDTRYKQVTPKRPTSVPRPAAPQQQEIIVSDLDEAKDYLCERYRYSRTKLKYEKAVLDAAIEHNIKFVFKD